MRYSIDRFEGEMAVLISDKDELHVPRKALPQGARAGDLTERDDKGGWMILVDATRDRRLRLLSRRNTLLEERK